MMTYFRVTLATDKIVKAENEAAARQEASKLFGEHLNICYGDLTPEPITEAEVREEEPWRFD